MNKRSGLGWLELISGILLIIFGVVAFVNPGGTLDSIVIIYGIIAIITGIADIVFYVKLEKRTGFGPAVSLVTGILSVLAGVLLVIHPGAGTLFIAFMFPIWFIAHCISKLSHLSVIRLLTGTGNYYLTMTLNIIGLILGIVMLFNPLLSISTMGYVIGFYLIVLGIDSIILAFSGVGSYRA